MAISAERALILCGTLLMGFNNLAQQGTTFAYTGKDAVASALNTHHVYFGGISNGVLVYEDAEQDFVWPYLPAIFFEYSYLLRPRNHVFNVHLDVLPEIYLFPWFVGRVTGLADLGLLAEADNKPGQGFGLRFGVGYTALGTTFDYAETSPVARLGFLVDNIRVTYMYVIDKDALVNHEVAVGIKLDM